MQQTKKVPVTVTMELGQLQRLDDLATRTRLNRSSIVRDALERELARHENGQRAAAPAAIDGGLSGGRGVGRRKTVRRR